MFCQWYEKPFNDELTDFGCKFSLEFGNFLELPYLCTENILWQKETITYSLQLLR